MKYFMVTIFVWASPWKKALTSACAVPSQHLAYFIPNWRQRVPSEAGRENCSRRAAVICVSVAEVYRGFLLPATEKTGVAYRVFPPWGFSTATCRRQERLILHSRDTSRIKPNRVVPKEKKL